MNEKSGALNQQASNENGLKVLHTVYQVNKIAENADSET